MGKSKSPAFQFYPDAWLSSTDIQLMTPAEEGAFIRLLCHEWLQEDCGLPDDDRSLAKLSRLGSAWTKSASKIRAKFVNQNGRLFNERLLEERLKQEQWRLKSREGGKKSAITRWQPSDKGGYQMVNDLEQPNGNSSSSSSSSLVSHTHGNASVTETEDGWGAFVVAWSDAGLIGASGPDWQSALEWWRYRLDISQRLASVAYLPSVDAANPVARMLPLGYLKSQAWTRKAAQPRAATTPAKNANDERMARVIAKLEAEGR